MRSLFRFALPCLGLLWPGLPSSHAADPAKPVVTLTASVATTDETAAKPGLITFYRSGDLSASLTVSFDLGGSAKADVDYHGIPTTLTFPAGAATATVAITAIGDFEKQPLRTVFCSLRSDPAYQVGPAGRAIVTITDAPPELFVAALRPTAEAPESTAYGTAVLLLAPDHSRARVTVSHANLSSPFVVAHLKLGDPGH